MKEFLINKNEFFASNKDHFPGIIFKDKFYFTKIHLDDWECRYEVYSFDFN